MKAITILKQEHQLILRGLAVAQSMAILLQRGNEVFFDDVSLVVDFIQSYADTFHHKKEEDILFKWMHERGFPSGGGPIQVMLYEHDLGRSCINNILSVLNKDQKLIEDKETVIRGVMDFVQLLTQHISKEDNILYMMAESLAEKDSDEILLSRYRNKIAESESEEIQNKYEVMIQTLEKKYVS